MLPLDPLRRERSEINQFATKIEFDRWADQVKAALTEDAHAYRTFKHYAAIVESHYALKIDPLNAINNAIGVVSEVVARPVLVAQPLVEEAPQRREAESPDKEAKNIVQQPIVTLKKFLSHTASKVLTSLIVLIIVYYVGLFYGIKLR